MPPETKVKRACAGGHAGAGAADRLSALPDGLLHAVLSFLPAPQVVRTCVLSRRWRDLWRSAPYINIDEREFGITLGYGNFPEEKWHKFEDFTTNLLLFRDSTSSLDKFRLYAHGHNKRHVDRWIRRGIKCCPAVLHIVIFQLCYKLPVLGSNFRRLERLRLYNLSLDSRFAEQLRSGCPVLEDLVLDSCKNYFGDITSPTLKKLVIEWSSNNTSRPLVITAPRLTYLSLASAYYQNGISVGKMASLVNASIEVTNCEAFTEKTQRRLLGGLFNVTRLKLCGFEAGVMLNEKSDKFPIFCNLRTLYLESCFLDELDLDDKLEALGSFLENAPCLEKLTLRCCMFYSFSDSEWEIERKNITLQRQDGKTFQCHKLKLIEVIYDYDHDHQLIELLWDLGRSLPDASIKLTKISTWLLANQTGAADGPVEHPAEAHLLGLLLEQPTHELYCVPVAQRANESMTRGRTYDCCALSSVFSLGQRDPNKASYLGHGA